MKMKATIYSKFLIKLFLLQGFANLLQLIFRFIQFNLKGANISFFQPISKNKSLPVSAGNFLNFDFRSTQFPFKFELIVILRWFYFIKVYGVKVNLFLMVIVT